MLHPQNCSHSGLLKMLCCAARERCGDQRDALPNDKSLTACVFASNLKRGRRIGNIISKPAACSEALDTTAHVQAPSQLAETAGSEPHQPCSNPRQAPRHSRPRRLQARHWNARRGRQPGQTRSPTSGPRQKKEEKGSRTEVCDLCFPGPHVCLRRRTVAGATWSGAACRAPWLRQRRRRGLPCSLEQGAKLGIRSKLKKTQKNDHCRACRN